MTIGTVVAEICWFWFVTWFRETTWLKGVATLWVGAPHSNSPPTKFGGHKHCGSGDINILAFLQIRLFYHKCLISVTVYAHLLPPLLFSLKYMACHVLHTSRITTFVTFLSETFFSVPNEISPILFTRFLGNEWRNIFKRTIINPLLKHGREGGEKNSNYTDNCKAFYVTRKCNKLTYSMSFCRTTYYFTKKDYSVYP